MVIKPYGCMVSQYLCMGMPSDFILGYQILSAKWSWNPVRRYLLRKTVLLGLPLGFFEATSKPIGN